MMCGGPRHSPAIRKEASRKGRLFSIMRQSVSAVGQAFDQARRAGKQQREEEQQQTHEDRADHGGRRDVDQQQNQRKQDGAQRAGHQRAQVGAQARARTAMMNAAQRNVVLTVSTPVIRRNAAITPMSRLAISAVRLQRHRQLQLQSSIDMDFHLPMTAYVPGGGTVRVS